MRTLISMRSVFGLAAVDIVKNVTRIIGSVCLAFACQAEAMTVQYAIDQSNVLEDDIDYLTVMISDDGDGQLDFLVEPQTALTKMAGSNFGIQSFALSLSGFEDASMYTYLLPEGWRTSFNRNVSEAGRFDVLLKGTGQVRQDPLQFSIAGLALGDIEPRFASHTAGFSCAAGPKEGACITSAYFYGGSRFAVPLPPALWLFGSGLLFLAGLTRRRQATD